MRQYLIILQHVFKNITKKKLFILANTTKMIQKTDAEWKAQLNDLEYLVMRNKGTERPYTGLYNDFYEKGTYFCNGCGHALFSSDDKFNSSCGWPSFKDELETANIKKIVDKSHGMIRTEIVCSNCDSHLGHVFNDGPPPTGLRYCMNSVSMRFEKD